MKLYQAVTADEYEYDIANAPTLKELADILRVDKDTLIKALKNYKIISTPYSEQIGYSKIRIRRLQWVKD